MYLGNEILGIVSFLLTLVQPMGCLTSFSFLRDDLDDGFKYCLFTPQTLGKWSNLTSIFFRWVVQPPPSHCLLACFIFVVLHPFFLKRKDGTRAGLGWTKILRPKKCVLPQLRVEKWIVILVTVVVFQQRANTKVWAFSPCSSWFCLGLCFTTWWIGWWANIHHKISGQNLVFRVGTFYSGNLWAKIPASYFKVRIYAVANKS